MAEQNWQGALKQIGDGDDTQLHYVEERIGLRIESKVRAYLMDIITNPQTDIKYYYARKKGFKTGNCYDPPKDNYEWNEIRTHMQIFKTKQKHRKLKGHNTLKRDPANTGKSSRFQYDNIQKEKQFECKYKMIGCPAIKWVNVGQNVNFMDIFIPQGEKWKLYFVLYENEHNHEPLDTVPGQLGVNDADVQENNTNNKASSEADDHDDEHDIIPVRHSENDADDQDQNNSRRNMATEDNDNIQRSDSLKSGQADNPDDDNDQDIGDTWLAFDDDNLEPYEEDSFDNMSHNDNDDRSSNGKVPDDNNDYLDVPHGGDEDNNISTQMEESPSQVTSGITDKNVSHSALKPTEDNINNLKLFIYLLFSEDNLLTDLAESLLKLSHYKEMCEEHLRIINTVGDSHSTFKTTDEIRNKSHVTLPNEDMSQNEEYIELQLREGLRRIQESEELLARLLQKDLVEDSVPANIFLDEEDENDLDIEYNEKDKTTDRTTQKSQVTSTNATLEEENVMDIAIDNDESNENTPTTSNSPLSRLTRHKSDENLLIPEENIDDELYAISICNNPMELEEETIEQTESRENSRSNSIKQKVFKKLRLTRHKSDDNLLTQEENIDDELYAISACDNSKELEEGTIEQTESRETSRSDSIKQNFVKKIKKLTTKSQSKVVDSTEDQHTEEDHRTLFPDPKKINLNLIKNFPSCCKAYFKSYSDKEKEEERRREENKRRSKSQQDKNPTPLEQTYRTFENEKKESCWLNSCCQLMIGGLFDHMENRDNIHESDMWKKLKEMKQMKRKINPLAIRELLYDREKDRIVDDKIAPVGRLFHYAGTTTFNRSKLIQLDLKERQGQQDCKDFFMSLWACRHEWFDVSELISCNRRHYIYCPECEKYSHPQVDETTSPYIFIDSPSEELKMDEVVNVNINGPNSVTWTHDDGGCGKKTNGQSYQRFKNLEKQEFLIFIMNRVTQNEDEVKKGTMKINKTNITVTPTIDIVESKDEDPTESGTSIQFEPIAVIHHTGDTSRGNTFGHYRADILDHESKKWIRTSDDEPVEEIDFSNITKQGYIFLYKNTHKRTKTSQLVLKKDELKVINDENSLTKKSSKGKGKGKSSQKKLSKDVPEVKSDKKSSSTNDLSKKNTANADKENTNKLEKVPLRREFDISKLIFKEDELNVKCKDKSSLTKTSSQRKKVHSKLANTSAKSDNANKSTAAEGLKLPRKVSTLIDPKEPLVLQMKTMHAALPPGFTQQPKGSLLDQLTKVVPSIARAPELESLLLTFIRFYQVPAISKLNEDLIQFAEHMITNLQEARITTVESIRDMVIEIFFSLHDATLDEWLHEVKRFNSNFQSFMSAVPCNDDTYDHDVVMTLFILDCIPILLEIEQFHMHASASNYKS